MLKIKPADVVPQAFEYKNICNYLIEPKIHKSFLF